MAKEEYDADKNMQDIDETEDKLKKIEDLLVEVDRLQAPQNDEDVEEYVDRLRSLQDKYRRKLIDLEIEKLENEEEE
jgi:hypothetical protein